jgi:hypothetical protein
MACRRPHRVSGGGSKPIVIKQLEYFSQTLIQFDAVAREASPVERRAPATHPDLNHSVLAAH